MVIGLYGFVCVYVSECVWCVGVCVVCVVCVCMLQDTDGRHVLTLFDLC